MSFAAGIYLHRRRPAARLVARGAHSPASALLHYPGPAATLVAPTITFPPGFGARRVFVDPGHGARDNRGNSSTYCVDEQDFTLGAARELADRLNATGHFQVKLARDGGRPVEYSARIEDAAAFGAEAFISLHSDVRGHAELWSPSPGLSCRRSVAAPGFSVLWSDEAESPLKDARLSLARAAARRMRDAGFPAYSGPEYIGLYEGDGVEPGVFVDRHAPRQRILILRRTTMPAILIETHNALDPREADRWSEPRTYDAFAGAVAAALVDALTPSPPMP